MRNRWGRTAEFSPDERTALEIVMRLKAIKKEQLKLLLVRNGISEAATKHVVWNLYQYGYVSYDQLFDAWKLTKEQMIDTIMILLVWLALENTEGSQNELSIYRDMQVDTEAKEIAYFKDSGAYYIKYIRNKAGAMCLGEFFERISDRADEDPDATKILLVSHDTGVFSMVPETGLKWYAIHAADTGSDRPEFTILGGANV